MNARGPGASPSRSSVAAGVRMALAVLVAGSLTGAAPPSAPASVRAPQRAANAPAPLAKPAVDAPKNPPAVTIDPKLIPAAAARAPASHGGVEGVTRCELCHTTAGWTSARFAHERTGFPLIGAHQTAQCRACHTKDFTEPLGQRCSGCHQDPHRGELGQRCEGCHDSTTWTSAFAADAHRRTAFPLDGRHALIPCEECHAESRDRRFARPAKGCAECHAGDYPTTAAGGRLDHVALGFGQRCEQCHTPSAFKPARFPGHDLCFVISSGSHANIACESCHSTIPAATLGGSCTTFTASCTSCHEHQCGKSDREHEGVQGYRCSDRRCYECHEAGRSR